MTSCATVVEIIDIGRLGLVCIAVESARRRSPIAGAHRQGGESRQDDGVAILRTRHLINLNPVFCGQVPGAVVSVLQFLEILLARHTPLAAKCLARGVPLGARDALVVGSDVILERVLVRPAGTI